jgi:hypothetical protein
VVKLRVSGEITSMMGRELVGVEPVRTILPSGATMVKSPPGVREMAKLAAVYLPSETRLKVAEGKGRALRRVTFSTPLRVWTLRTMSPRLTASTGG